jgi:uncharacterized membrane protein YdjX (TVP38/TMEM64 family)
MNATQQTKSDAPSERSRVLNTVLTVLAVAAVALFAYLLIDSLPLIREVWRNRANEAASVADVKQFGIRGVALIGLLQAMLTTTAVLPDMPVQVLAGLVFGRWAILICLAGMLLSNTVVFLAARYGGDSFQKHFHHDKHPSAKHPAANKLLSFEKLKNMKHPQWLVFFINLIPGFPNGMLPLIFGRTRMSLAQFLLYAALGELPSLAISTGIGTALVSGNRTITIILVIALVLILAGAYLFKDRLTIGIEKLSSRK